MHFPEVSIHSTIESARVFYLYSIQSTQKVIIFKRQISPFPKCSVYPQHNRRLTAISIF